MNNTRAKENKTSAGNYYYILYKAIKDETGAIIDAENTAEFDTYREIQAYIESDNRRDIKKMLVEDINNLENINLFRGNYFIIKEEEELEN